MLVGGGGEEVRSNEAAAEGVVEEVFGRAARIVDGDTFWLARLKVRLWGVDSPELQQGCVAEGKVWHCGEEARAKLRSIVAGGEVRCVVRGRSYDRVCGVGVLCEIEGVQGSCGVLWRVAVFSERVRLLGSYKAAERER